MSDTSRDKKQRPPKPFKRPLKPGKYQRKLAGRIFLEPDREFLSNITSQDDDGRIVLARELSKDERARLKKLRKAAAKNRRGPRTVRLAILAILVGAILVFNILFKDRLVEAGAEDLLEGLFNARVDLDGVRFQPWRGEIRFSSLVIADAAAPMTNLAELSTGALRVDTWQLVNRRVLIDELTVQGLQFGTPRESSGALPVREPEDGGAAGIEENGADARGSMIERVADALPPISFADLGLPDTLDAAQFLKDNVDALQTTASVAALTSDATDFVSRWTGEIASLRDELLEVGQEIQDFAQTDFRSIRSVDAAMAVYDNATDLEASVTGVATEIEARYDAVLAEATTILEAAKALPDQVAGDYEALLARIPDVRAEGRDFIVGLAEPYVRQALGAWYGRIERGMAVYQRLTADGVERKPRRARRVGTDIDFSSRQYPRFLLADASLGVGAAGSEQVAARITNLSSDPDLVSGPALVTYRQDGPAGELAVDVTIDGRTGADTGLRLAVRSDGSSLAVRRGLEPLDLSSVTGTVSAAAELKRAASGVFDGTLRLDITDLAAAGTFEPQSLGGFIADVLNQAGYLAGSFGFTIASRDDVRFHSGETNLDDIVSGAIRDLVNATVAAFREELRVRVSDYLDPLVASANDRLGGVIEIETSAEELLELARDREAAAARLEQLAQDSITAIRDQLEAEARAALDAAKAEAEARAQAAIDAAEAEARAKAAEAEAAARAAAEEAAAAAEDTVQDAASDAVDTIRNQLTLPSRR